MKDWTREYLEEEYLYRCETEAKAWDKVHELYLLVKKLDNDVASLKHRNYCLEEGHTPSRKPWIRLKRLLWGLTASITPKRSPHTTGVSAGRQTTTQSFLKEG